MGKADLMATSCVVPKGRLKFAGNRSGGVFALLRVAELGLPGSLTQNLGDIEQ